MHPKRVKKRTFVVGMFLPPPHFSPAPFIRGVGRFTSEITPWHVEIAETLEPFFLKRFLKQCDGIIAPADALLFPMLRELKIPVVVYLGGVESDPFPMVGPDEEAIGAMGADHLLARGYRQFAFFGMPGSWSQAREAGFVGRLRRAGFGCLTTTVGKSPGTPATWEQLDQPAFLPRWIKRLKPPAAIMACNDASGRRIIDVCERLGRRVPEDIAVLGVDNDELLCNYASVGLSSIDRNLDRIGFETCRLLERVVNKQASPGARVRVPPGPLVARRSTEASAVTDPDAAAAVRFISLHGCTEMDVRDVLAAVPVSRRALERKLSKALGRTPAQEIRRVRLARACELLTGTDLSLSAIAHQTGFQYRTYLSTMFKKTFGETPRQFRKRTRGR